MTVAIAVASALISLVLTLVTFERFITHRRRHDLTWTVALGLFVLGAASLAWGAATGWTRAPFRAFYLFGAIVNVPFLAAGQLEISTWRHRRAARPIAALFCAVATGVCVSCPMQLARTEELPKGSNVFGVLPRVLAAVGSGTGATIVLVGAALSSVRHFRAGARRRSAGTALIALGTVVLSLSGLLNSVVGEMQGFAIMLGLGVAILFCGFVLASNATPGSVTRS